MRVALGGWLVVEDGHMMCLHTRAPQSWLRDVKRLSGYERMVSGIAAFTSRERNHVENGWMCGWRARKDAVQDEETKILGESVYSLMPVQFVIVQHSLPRYPRGVGPISC